MPKKIAIDTPLSELILRKYEKPHNIEGRELVRKLCLSLGLLQPGDSRDVIVDVLHVLLKAKKEQKKLKSEEIRSLVIEERKNNNLPQNGIAASNIRRQLKRLRNIFLIEKTKNYYRITENESLNVIFKEKISKFILDEILVRIEEYFKKIEEKF